MENVARAVTRFLQHLVSYIADASTSDALFRTLVGWAPNDFASGPLNY